MATTAFGHTYILHLHGGLFIEVTRLPVPDICIDLDSTYPPRHGTLTNRDPTDMEMVPKDLDGLLDRLRKSSRHALCKTQDLIVKVIAPFMTQFPRMPLPVRQVRSLVIDPEAPVSLKQACGAGSVELPAVSAEEQTAPFRRVKFEFARTARRDGSSIRGPVQRGPVDTRHIYGHKQYSRCNRNDTRDGVASRGRCNCV